MNALRLMSLGLVFEKQNHFSLKKQLKYCHRKWKLDSRDFQAHVHNSVLCLIDNKQL